MEKITINKTQLKNVLEYINSVLEAVDVEDEEILSEINEGYKNIVEPLVKLAYSENDGEDEEDIFVIAKKADLQTFKEHLEDIYEVDVEKISDKEIEEMYDELGEILANNDEYAEIYNDAVWQVLKTRELN